MRKIRLFIFSVMVMMLVLCCYSSKSDAAVYLSNKKIYLTEGKSYRLYVYGAKKKCVWSSSNKKIATVGSKGKVKAKKAGKVTIKAKITVKAKKKTKIKIKKCIVYVQEKKTSNSNNYSDKEETISKNKSDDKVYNYELSQTVLNLQVDDYKTLDVKNESFFDTVKWKSDNPSVATVSSNGYVRAKSQGKAIVTVTIDGWKASCEVNVYEKLELENTSYKITYHGSQKILSGINSSDMISYISEDENIATVDNDGVIYGKNLGKTNIKINYCDREYEIYVHVKIDDSDVKVSGDKKILVGQTDKISVEYANEDIRRDFPVSYRVNDEDICEVDQEGNIYTKKSGDAYIYISAGDILIRSCWINVFNFGYDDELAIFEPGDSDYYSPRGIEGSKCIVKSNDESIIKISNVGNQFYIEAIAPGRTTITYTYGDFSIDREVYVRLHVPDAIKTGNYLGFDEYEKSTLQAVRLAIDNAISPNMTTSQKVRAIHDYIVLNCDYDYHSYLNGTIPNESYTYVGVFKNRVAVCNGYSQAFMLCMEVLDIPCRFVVGYANGSHSWNQVYIDGTWYYIDTTWDDPVINGNINPNYITWNYYLNTSIWGDHTISYAHDDIDFDLYLNPNEIIFFSRD